MSEEQGTALAKPAHKGSENLVPFQKGFDPRRFRGTPPEVLEVQQLARTHAKKAFERLVHLVEHGSAAVQVQAARAVLGVAGVSLTPDARAQGAAAGLPSAPVSMGLRELVALVRGLSPADGATGAMPRLSSSSGTPPPPPPPSGAVEAEYREITQESGSGASPAPAPSGCEPDRREA